MKYRTLLALFLFTMVLCSASVLSAQELTAEEEERVAEIEENLKYNDYTIKAYRLTFFGGNFSGATFLENPELADITVLTPGAGDILGFDGEVLPQSTWEYEDGTRIYDATHKEIESGTAYGGRVGIYISQDFHLDLLGTYAKGRAVTSMIGPPDLAHANIDERHLDSRHEIDSDDGFKMVKGGLALMYDAKPAALFGVTPRLGFGLGGIINRYSRGLEDKTALYLEGNFGLGFEVFDNIDIMGQVDLTTFAYQVDELGYSNMVSYATFSLGISWFIDVVPSNVRAAHLAELQAED